MTEYLQIREDELQDLYAMTHRDYEQQAIGIHQRVHVRSRPAPPAQPNPCALLESSRCIRGLVPNLFCFDGVKGVKSHRPCAYYIRSRPAPAAPRIGKLSDAELDEIAEESYRQITGNQPPTAPDIKAIEEKLKERIRLAAEAGLHNSVVAYGDAINIIRKIRQDGE